MKTLKRPKISVYIAASIDGYIAKKDGDIAWLEMVQDVGEDYGHKDFYGSIDALVLGRKTYEVVSAFSEWPYTGKKVVVLSKTLNSVREGVELFSGDIQDLVSKLQETGVKHVWVDGGVTVSSFLGAGLVDELTVTIIPIILGAGVPLFNEMSRELHCKMIASRAYESGIVQLLYKLDNFK